MTDLDFDVALEEGAVRPGSHHAQRASADADAARALAGAVLRRLPVGPAEGEDDAAWGALGLIDQAEESLDMPGGDFDVPAITAAEMLEDDAYGAEVWVPTAPQTVVAPRSRAWIWGVLASFLIGVGAFAAFFALPDGDEGERLLAAASTPSTAPASAPTTGAPTTAGPASLASRAAPPSDTDDAGDTGDAPSSEAPPSAAPESAAAAPKPTRAARRSTRRAPQPKAPAVAAAPATSAPKRSAARPKKKASGEVDNLLGGLNGTGKPKAARPAAAVLDDPALPEKLSKSQILRVVRSNAGKVSACKRAGASGTVKVVMVIGRNGRVTSATPGGAFAGTPAGVCVAAKVRTFRFPQFSGDPMRINMPFRL